MIARKHRFHRRASIRGVFRYGQKKHCGGLSIHYKEKSAEHPSRFAVNVSTSVVKSAVVRNRIRRRIYGIVEQLQPGVSNGIDIVFVVKDKSFASIDAKSLQTSLKSCLRGAGILQS